MKKGDLVKWSHIWLDGCKTAGGNPEENIAIYSKQIGVILYRVQEPRHCYRVLWSDNDVCDVHYDYLEVLCE